MKKTETIKNKISQKDMIAYRFAISAVMAIIGIILVDYISGSGIVTLNFLTKALVPTTVLFSVLSVAAIVYFAACKVRKIDESKRLITSNALLVYAVSGLIATVSYNFIGIEDDIMRIVPLIAMPILYYIYYTFNSVFFIVSAQCAVGYLAMNKLSGVAGGTQSYIIGAAAVIACVVIGYMALIAVSKLKNDAGEKKLNFYIMSAIIIAGILLSFFVPGIITYAIFTLIAAYLVIAVISTIELM